MTNNKTLSGNSTLTLVGVVVVIAAVVGGGISVSGNTIPIISEPWRQLLLGSVGVGLIYLGGRAGRSRTFLVTQPISSISAPKGTFENLSYETTTFGGRTRRIKAADYRRGEDGSYVFVDGLGRTVCELPNHEVQTINVE